MTHDDLGERVWVDEDIGPKPFTRDERKKMRLGLSYGMGTKAFMDSINKQYHDGKRKIRGKFWMVQSHVVAPVGKNDTFGRATFDWPGKTIFTSEDDARRCCEILAKKTGHAFFIMEATSMIEVANVVYKETKL